MTAMLETHVIGSYVQKPIESFNGGMPSSSIQQGMTLIGNKRAPNRTLRSMYVKAGSPTSGNAQGDGTLILPGEETKTILLSGKEQPSKEGQSVP
jgi:hypothetical protein